MSDYLEITLTGADGSHWDLSGPSAGEQGVMMRPKPNGLIDAPVKTMWIKSAFGQKYQDRKFQRRDVVFSVQIHGGGNSDEWHEIDSQFRMALGMYDDQCTITYITSDGARSLRLRLLEEPKAYETAAYEDRDPHIFGDSTLVITAAAEQPFWFSEPITDSWVLSSGTSGSGTLTVSNPGDVPLWPKYTVTAPSTWVLSDRSWGQDLYGQAVEHAARTETLPALLVGEDSDLDSRPDEEPIIAANRAPVWTRWNGRGLLYPIPPHTPPTEVPVSVSGAVAGASVEVTLEPWFSRPWGVTR